jgi:hypothetical protein
MMSSLAWFFAIQIVLGVAGAFALACLRVLARF